MASTPTLAVAPPSLPSSAPPTSLKLRRGPSVRVRTFPLYSSTDKLRRYPAVRARALLSLPALEALTRA